MRAVEGLNLISWIVKEARWLKWILRNGRREKKEGEGGDYSTDYEEGEF